MNPKGEMKGTSLFIQLVICQAHFGITLFPETCGGFVFGFQVLRLLDPLGKSVQISGQGLLVLLMPLSKSRSSITFAGYVSVILEIVDVLGVLSRETTTFL